MVPIEPCWPAPPNVIAFSTTREGGYSSGVFRGLNLGHHVGDHPETVQANREQLRPRLGENSQVQWLSQVHGANAVPAGVGSPYPQADASWTRVVGQACAVLTADCLPVLFCNRQGTIVAAAHAGWRGMIMGVLEATIAAMSVPPGDILAWLGPAIGPAAFEVGPEVKSQFLRGCNTEQQQRMAACFRPHSVTEGHYFADLYALARARLASVGVVRVFGGEHCTFSDPERFYSYRRDGKTGRMASLIYLKST